MMVTGSLVPRVAEVLKLLRKLNIRADIYLDLGCNDGQISRIIAEIVKAKEVYGIDINRNALEKRCRKRVAIDS